MSQPFLRVSPGGWLHSVKSTSDWSDSAGLFHTCSQARQCETHTRSNPHCLLLFMPSYNGVELLCLSGIGPLKVTSARPQRLLKRQREEALFLSVCVCVWEREDFVVWDSDVEIALHVLTRGG